MTTKPAALEMVVSDQAVQVVYKDIENVHVSVHPPDGRVRVAAPIRLDVEAVRLAVVSRLTWIRRQQHKLAQQSRQSQREMTQGESHFFMGHRYRLSVQTGEHSGVRVKSADMLELSVRRGTDRQARERVLRTWYRDQLRSILPDLVAKWEERLQVKVEVRVRRMKTRWGTCNPAASRVWLNLELAKKPPACIEYVLVHEMVHLLERLHNDRFRDLMDQVMPTWRLHRDELNAAPLAHEKWAY